MSDTCKTKKCRWQRELPYNTHIRCAHPLVPKTPIGDLMSMMNRQPVGLITDLYAKAELGIRHNQAAVKMGWFNWPWNFDPVWLERCSGFEEAEQTCPCCGEVLGPTIVTSGSIICLKCGEEFRGNSCLD